MRDIDLSFSLGAFKTIRRFVAAGKISFRGEKETAPKFTGPLLERRAARRGRRQEARRPVSDKLGSAGEDSRVAGEKGGRGLSRNLLWLGLALRGYDQAGAG